MRKLLPAVAIVLSVAALARAEDARLSVADAGAVGDGVTLNTAAIQAAIERLAKQGGGTLVVPAGRFLTGAIFLKPRVNLHLETDATLLGSPDIADYPEMSTRIEGATNLWRPAIVNADRCDGLRITGGGTIRGGGKVYWDAFNDRRKSDRSTKNLDVPRPRNVFVRDSRDVVIRGVSLRDSGFWNLHLYRCQSATIDGVDIRSPADAPSTDGIDVDSCQDVTIRDCYVSVNDDDIALKGTKGPLADKDADSPAVERIHIVGCTFAAGHGVVTLGSEACVVRDVLVEDCKVVAPPAADRIRNRTALVRLKLRPDTPQRYVDLTFRNIHLDTDGRLFDVGSWTQYFDLQGQPEPSQLVERLTLENVTGTAGGFGRISGPKRATIRDVVLRNVDVTLADARANLRGVDGLKIENVRVNGAPLVGPTTRAAE